MVVLPDADRDRVYRPGTRSRSAVAGSAKQRSLILYGGRERPTRCRDGACTPAGTASTRRGGHGTCSVSPTPNTIKLCLKPPKKLHMRQPRVSRPPMVAPAAAFGADFCVEVRDDRQDDRFEA